MKGFSTAFTFSSLGSEDAWPEYGTGDRHNFAATLLFFTFSLANIIVLLNLLIAVISDTYDKI